MTDRTSKKSKGTRMWGVVTPRGKVLDVDWDRGLLRGLWHYELNAFHCDPKRARIVRVRVFVETSHD